jgi:carbon-monoxide dehydrogenase medium subunit
MKPAPFAYVAPDTLDEATSALAEHGYDAKVLAGGQSLIPVMNFRLAQPAVLVDINRVPGLDFIREQDGTLHIGAMVRQATLARDPLVARFAPLIHETMPYIAHPQIRNRGTIGGSLAHADPAGELPVLAVALDARLRLVTSQEERWVTAKAFYRGLFETLLQPEDLLVEIAVPCQPAGTGSAFAELARRHGDYATAGVAAVVTLNADGTCRAARLVFLNAGEIPMDAVESAAMLVGRIPDEAAIAAAADHASTHEIDPDGDVHAGEAYKRHLAGIMARRALAQAVARAAQNR